MSRIFITGSSDGLGELAARELVKQGHSVVLHARIESRAEDAMRKVPGAENVLIADLADREATKRLAEEVNALGSFDAIIQNAGVYTEPGNIIFNVNVLAPYILTALVQKPKRLIYLSSGSHKGGDAGRIERAFETGSTGYSDSKLMVTMLSMGVGRIWPDVYSNALDPGWVPTKMGGAGAPDNLQKGYETQVWLATSNDDQALVTGQYFYHQRESSFIQDCANADLQVKLFDLCEKATGISLK